MSSPKILVIENQLTQFETIHRFLGTDFQIFPENKRLKYRSFINLIRVFLHTGYGEYHHNEDSYRGKVFKEILEEIDRFDPKVILMDHILLGFHEANDGIDLAKFLRRAGISTPIIFLSRTRTNSAKAINAKQHVSDCDWLPKGIDGQENLTADYLLTKVTDQIKLRIAQIPKIDLEDRVDFMLESIKALMSRDVHDSSLDHFKILLENHRRQSNLRIDQLMMLPERSESLPKRSSINNLFKILSAN